MGWVKKSPQPDPTRPMHTPNEDKDHSKDASSISLLEDDRRELMENFNGAGQDYEDLSSNNVAPLANNGALFDSRIYGQDYKDLFGNNLPSLANNMVSFPNQFQAMDGNYGTSPQFVGQPM